MDNPFAKRKAEDQKASEGATIEPQSIHEPPHLSPKAMENPSAKRKAEDQPAPEENKKRLTENLHPNAAAAQVTRWKPHDAHTIDLNVAHAKTITLAVRYSLYGHLKFSS
jgi:hypothetical protein